MKPLLLSLILALTILPACAETAAKPDDTAMTNWVLDQIDGKAPGWSATISLADPGQISGQAPCNRYFAGPRSGMAPSPSNPSPRPRWPAPIWRARHGFSNCCKG